MNLFKLFFPFLMFTAVDGLPAGGAEKEKEKEELDAEKVKAENEALKQQQEELKKQLAKSEADTEKLIEMFGMKLKGEEEEKEREKEKEEEPDYDNLSPKQLLSLMEKKLQEKTNQTEKRLEEYRKEQEQKERVVELQKLQDKHPELVKKYATELSKLKTQYPGLSPDLALQVLVGADVLKNKEIEGIVTDPKTLEGLKNAAAAKPDRPGGQGSQFSQDFFNVGKKNGLRDIIGDIITKSGGA